MIKPHLYPRMLPSRNLLRETYNMARAQFPVEFRTRELLYYIKSKRLLFSRQQIWRNLHFISRDPRSGLVRVKKAHYRWIN